MTSPVISWDSWEEKFKPTTEVMLDFYDEAVSTAASSYHI